MSVTKPYEPVGNEDESILQTSTLILPTISIGNLPQLTVDLLINNFNFVKIGYLNDLYLYPFASPIDYVSNPIEGISHAIEVYYSKDLNLTVVQQRSPIIPSYTTPFINEVIVPFIQNFKQVIVLNSADSGLIESVNSGDILIYDNEDLSTNLEKLTITNSPEDEDKNSIFMSKLLKSLKIGKKDNLKVLISYNYEGDNFDDAIKMINKLIEILKISKPGDWQKPISWKGVYGDKDVPNAMEEGIFG
ncbi:uncharacterized protein KGF55_001532 [Candida pseudojiufengensis]|uniref:uncharacterized protein n=1 Tax=Candida pseudojiufengensis TaxID=497109 RepID=UPI002224ED26|nr:uncharacterized protein KGF55_001532 [Candida pseudojiufengensis]KAI5965311.1 hypothetical protein KGF55_001532 [Candida pseudojiufengensis]